MAEALSGALGNADAGTLALIQQLVEEKRKALEAVAPRVSLQSCLSGEAAAAPSAEAPSFAEVAAEIERPHRSQPIAAQMPFRQPSYAAPTGSAAEPVDLSANEVAPRQEAHYNVHDAYPPAAGVDLNIFGARYAPHRLTLPCKATLNPVKMVKGLEPGGDARRSETHYNDQK